MEVAAPKPWVELWLELETRCNLKCPFCYNYWKSGSLPEPSRASRAATVAGLQRILASVDCRKVAVSGGEPLLRSDLLELLSAIREFHVPMVLTTNGVLLSAKRLQDLMDAGIAHFQVPLHSHQPATHDLLSGVQCWDQSSSHLASPRARSRHYTRVCRDRAERDALWCRVTHFRPVRSHKGYFQPVHPERSWREIPRQHRSSHGARAD